MATAVLVGCPDPNAQRARWPGEKVTSPSFHPRAGHFAGQLPLEGARVRGATLALSATDCDRSMPLAPWPVPEPMCQNTCRRQYASWPSVLGLLFVRPGLHEGSDECASQRETLRVQFFTLSASYHLELRPAPPSRQPPLCCCGIPSLLIPCASGGYESPIDPASNTEQRGTFRKRSSVSAHQGSRQSVERGTDTSVRLTRPGPELGIVALSSRWVRDCVGNEAIVLRILAFTYWEIYSQPHPMEGVTLDVMTSL